jgi:glutathione S-transferase
MPASYTTMRRAGLDASTQETQVKLYYSPGACSLAAHIALLEVGCPLDLERVDLRRKVTETGKDFNVLNSKGYVPALVLDDGSMVTENIAVLDWITIQYPPLGIEGERGRTRLVEALAYISTEIHKSFRPFWHGASETEKADAGLLIIRRLNWLAERMAGTYLFGDRPTVADFYLFVTLRWAERFGIEIPQALAILKRRIESRPEVRAAIAFEETPALMAGTA